MTLDNNLETTPSDDSAAWPAELTVSPMPRRTAIATGAALLGAGIVTAALPGAAAAASPYGDAPEPTEYTGIPTAIASNNNTGPGGTRNDFLNLSWQGAGSWEPITYRYSVYYNDVTPRELAFTGVASGYIQLDVSETRWQASNGTPGYTMSVYVIDGNGNRYYFENKYKNQSLDFIAA